MTPKQEAALRQALEALEPMQNDRDDTTIQRAIAALRRALANQALEKKAENARELGLDYEPVWNDLPSNKDVEDAMRMKRLNQLATPPAAQPAEEPVGEMRLSQIVDGMIVPVVEQNLPVGTKLYTRPQPVAQWVDLSFEDSEEIIGKAPTVIEAVQMTEAKLKEKNT